MNDRAGHGRTPLPIFGARKGAASTRELVFRILSRTFPCSIEELRQELKDRFRQKISYQAVRKSVLVLRDLGVVEHGRQGYLLARDWLIQTRSLVDEILDRYRGSQGAAVDHRAAYQTLTAHSLYECDTLWGDLVTTICQRARRTGGKRFVSINHHPWWLPLNVGRESRLFEQLKKLGFEACFVFTCRGPSLRWAEEFYASIGVKTRAAPGAGIPRTHYYNVIGDRVIEVILPAAAARKIERLFGGGFRPERLKPGEITRLGSEKTEIEMRVFLNPLMAAGLLQAAGMAERR